MIDYKKLYAHLFNAFTDVVDAIQRQDFGTARSILIRAQQESEELYLSMEDDRSHEKEQE